MAEIEGQNRLIAGILAHGLERPDDEALRCGGTRLLWGELRRNVLLRSLFFVIFAAATVACLFWSFTL